MLKSKVKIEVVSEASKMITKPGGNFRGSRYFRLPEGYALMLGRMYYFPRILVNPSGKDFKCPRWLAQLLLALRGAVKIKSCIQCPAYSIDCNIEARTYWWRCSIARKTFDSEPICPPPKWCPLRRSPKILKLEEGV